MPSKERGLIPRFKAIPYEHKFFFLVMLSFTAFTALFIASSWHWPVCKDTSPLHYVAREIHRGAVPYRDVWDMNFPGTYLLHWLILFIPGDMDLVWRSVDLALFAGIAIFMYLLTPKTEWYLRAFAPLAIVLWHISHGPYGIAQRDDFMTFLDLAAVYALLYRTPDIAAGRSLRLALSGICFGLSTTIKPYAGVMYVLCMLIYLLELKKYQSGWNLLRAAGVSVAGYLTGIGIVALWLVALGGGSYFFQMLFEFTLPIYSKLGYATSGLERKSLLFIQALSWEKIFALNLIVGFCFLSLGIGGPKSLSFRTRMLLAAILGGVAQYVLQMKFWAYHWSPYYAFASVLAVGYLSTLYWHLDRRVRLLASLLVILVCGYSVPLFAQRMSEIRNGMFQIPLPQTANPTRLVHFLKTRVGPNDTIQVLGCVESGALAAILRTGVRQSTPLVYDFCILGAGRSLPGPPRMRREVMVLLQERKPSLVIVEALSWPAIQEKYDRFQSMPELESWLKANYELDHSTNDYRIYRRK